MDQPPTVPPPGGQPPQGPDWGDMKNKVTSAQGPDRIILIAGLLFFVSTFLPWYRVRVSVPVVGFGTVSENAWGVGGLGVLAALLGVATFALAVAIVVGAVKHNPSTNLLMLVLAGGTLLFTFLRLVFEPGGDEARSVEVLSGGTFEISRGIGLWAAIVLAVVMTFGALQKFKAQQA